MSEQTGAMVRCVICGHQNPPGHRFCGMCARALPDPAKGAKASTAEPPTASALSQVEPQEAAPGVGIPAVTPSLRPPVASVPAASGAAVVPKPAARAPERPRDVRYLLEDEHPHRARNRGLVVVLVLLAALGLLIAWRTGALDQFVKWFEGGRPAVEQASGDVGATAAPAEPAQTPKPVNEKPAAETAVAPAAAPPAPKEVEAKPTVQKEVEKEVAAPAKAVPVSAGPPKPAPAKVAPKPAPVIDAAAGECGRRLRGLRKSAGRGDAKSRAALGALYAGGECVSRDLPTAYRFYAQALHADHENAQYAENLGVIWKQMSPAERQVATRSQ